MIELKQISKRYKMGDEVIHALDHVTMTVEDREFVAIVGPSGSGKSTLMNLVGCLDYPDEGEYLLDGEDVFDLSPRELSIIRNKKIGFVFQQFNLLGKLTAYENVELPLITWSWYHLVVFSSLQNPICFWAYAPAKRFPRCSYRE